MWKTIIAFVGFVALIVSLGAVAAPTANCYDPGGAAGDFPHIRCNSGWIGSPLNGLLDDDLLTGTVAIPAISAQYVLPTAGDQYVVCARGNRVFIECGAVGVVVVPAAGGYTFSVPDGACMGPMRLTGPNCAIIGLAAVGEVEFLHIVP